MASSSSSFFATAMNTSSLTSQPCKYDVFLNFRGEDTRRNFVSHLYAALCQKDLQTFFDDDELKRGEEIAQSLPQAIQDSTVAVLVFSKNYASSSWCLDELAEIIQCHESHGQIVIPVFYEVDPSHLRKQSDDVAVAFVKHEQNPKNAHKTHGWRDALTTAASLCGFDSKDFRNDHMLISKIVEDILEKLNQSMTWDGYENLVGMDSRIEQIKKVFTITPLEVCVLGIWGMGGVGKTTIAEVIYNMMSNQFQSCCFVRNVRQQAEAGGLIKLQEELVSKALGEENPAKYTFSAGPRPFLKARLGRKKMLIILDDVDDPLQIESLIGDPCWFGSESMILITSRDKQIFEGSANFIYKVELLNDDEALQLFAKSALKQKYPGDNYASLSNSIINYAQGNPLALKVLGSSLVGKKEVEWKNTINQLLELPNKDIQRVLQISYNGLNRVEKDIFLDIACFFKGVHTDIMSKIYRSSRFNIDIIIRVLVDKCLLTIFDQNTLKMHDLLQEMGKEIVRQEAKYPNQRSRLWDPEDVYEVFAENKEAEAVESINLDINKIKEIDLNPKVFMKMPNLKFLNFYRSYEEIGNLHLSQGLDYLPNKLRYLGWDKYPLESFPPNFQPENLVVLRLHHSNIKQLWNRAKEDLVASQETHGMLSMIVNGFRSLVKVPSYIYGCQLGKLTSLSLVNNKSITHFPTGRSKFLEALDFLDLSGCENLITFPETSSSVEQLCLNLTAIKEVPSSSVELLSKLKKLEMRHCRELESLPNNFFNKLTSLTELYLQGSLRFKALPEILEPMDILEFVNITDTAIEKFPSSIGNLKGLQELQISFINFENCFVEDHQALALSAEGFSSLQSLLIYKSSLRKLDEDLCFPSSVESLYLHENNFERIPATIKQLSRLRFLHIRKCERLQSLPELPSSVSTVFAEECGSLEQIWTLKQLPLDSQTEQTWRPNKIFNFSNCLKLDEDQCQAVASTLLRHYLTAFARNQIQKPLENFEMVYPGSRIPEWVRYQSMGDTIQIHLPSHWFNHLFLGFASYLSVDSVRGGVHLRYDCYFGDNYHSSNAYSEQLFIRRNATEHMLVWISREFSEWICRHDDNFEEDLVFFKFTSSMKNLIKSCGVIPLYAQKDEDDICETFDFLNLEVPKLKIKEVQ
ncbi:hypothetical protein K2173_026112 [Erythroxylum novogranatense]|uniref:ADP-ribosyl cyclase/cyclic ADP-ribose hydrolase n=1 Tax=Erythroxylum novogranatense TaxID=1862640 RepID=A0AAV8TW07_9ROSI|nr:hypothetical protein K2173_026112 [Erythroxylum novogranatense]